MEKIAKHQEKLFLLHCYFFGKKKLKENKEKLKKKRRKKFIISLIKFYFVSNYK
jgi:hypothetical protein